MADIKNPPPIQIVEETVKMVYIQGARRAFYTNHDGPLSLHGVIPAQYNTLEEILIHRI